MSGQKALVVSGGGSLEPALDHLAKAFRDATGKPIAITYRHDVYDCDVLIMPKSAIEQGFGFAGEVEDGAVSIGFNAGLGVAVRLGADVPDIDTVEKLREAALSADALLLTDNHSSSRHMESIFRGMKIYDQVASKIVRAPIGQLLIDRLLAGLGNELMFLSVTAIKARDDYRLILAGLLPDKVQYDLEFFAVPRRASANKDTAWEFVRFCSGPGRQILAANGFRT